MDLNAPVWRLSDGRQVFNRPYSMLEVLQMLRDRQVGPHYQVWTAPFPRYYTLAEVVRALARQQAASAPASPAPAAAPSEFERMLQRKGEAFVGALLDEVCKWGVAKFQNALNRL